MLCLHIPDEPSEVVIEGWISTEDGGWFKLCELAEAFIVMAGFRYRIGGLQAELITGREVQRTLLRTTISSAFHRIQSKA